MNPWRATSFEARKASSLESVTEITARATAKKLANFTAVLPKLNFEEVFNVFSFRS
jgi:hypothetical protein